MWLDVFREFGYSKDDNELTAWLSLLSANTYEEAEALCQKYPWMEEIFSEISEYVHNPEEVLGMFSEALKVMDDNMYQYMCDQHNALVKQQQETIKENEAIIQREQAEIQNLYKFSIQLIKNNSGTRESAVDELITNCGCSSDYAEELVQKYW